MYLLVERYKIGILTTDNFIAALVWKKSRALSIFGFRNWQISVFYALRNKVAVLQANSVYWYSCLEVFNG
jgi:hypothetical protein